jgi:hypothetical protein
MENPPTFTLLSCIFAKVGGFSIAVSPVSPASFGEHLQETKLDPHQNFQPKIDGEFYNQVLTKGTSPGIIILGEFKVYRKP